MAGITYSDRELAEWFLRALESIGHDVGSADREKLMEFITARAGGSRGRS